LGLFYVKLSNKISIIEEPMSQSPPSAHLIAEKLKAIQTFVQQGVFSKVEAEVNALLALDIDTDSRTMAHYLLAVSLRLQQAHTKAIETLHQLLVINAEHARAHQELAYNYRAMGEQQQASVHFYKATKLNPALLSAWQALLPVYQENGQSEALRLCQQQIGKLSRLPKPILAASDLLYDGKVLEADALCRQFLQTNKHSLDALLLLAEIALRLKAIPEAEFVLETCCELAPDNLEAKYELFKIYSKLGKFSKALELTEALCSKDTENVFYQVAKATALVGVGQLKEAINVYLALIERGRAEANVYLLLGHAYKTQGDIALSISAYQNAYQQQRFCGDAYWSLANTKTYRFAEDEVASMLAGTHDPELAVKEKVHLHFALGKYYEDEEQFDKSFFHYEQGNALQSSTLSYSSEKHTQFVQTQINTFTPDLVEQRHEIGCSDGAPIFIVGMPRAGSTLLEQILASHSQVDGTMELHEILGLAATLSKKQGNKPSYPLNLKQIPNDLFAKFGQKFIEETKVYRQGAAYFIDKMPNNYMHIGLIKMILPNAKIIDARREPMACCFSGFKQLFGEGQEFSYSLDDIGQYYQNYERLMAHWDALFPDEILLVRHEEVVADTENQVRRILDFCGLPFEQACLDFHKNKRAVKTPSAQQVRQPIYTSGLEQWRHFEPYLGSLKARFSK
jgi:tetratricopeptide (TPR) repeat protein